MMYIERGYCERITSAYTTRRVTKKKPQSTNSSDRPVAAIRMRGMPQAKIKPHIGTNARYVPVHEPTVSVFGFSSSTSLNTRPVVPASPTTATTIMKIKNVPMPAKYARRVSQVSDNARGVVVAHRCCRATSATLTSAVRLALRNAT